MGPDNGILVPVEAPYESIFCKGNFKPSDIHIVWKITRYFTVALCCIDLADFFTR